MSAVKAAKQPKMVAVLWHRSAMGDANIIGVFERPQDARALLSNDDSHQLLTYGGYHITMRALTKNLPDAEPVPWP